MRFGFCGSMVALQPDKTGVEIIEQLKEAGYDYIELSLSHMVEMSETDFAVLKKRVAASGLICESCNNFYPPDMRLTGPDIDWNKIETYTEYALERAGQLGAKTVVFGSGPAKKAPEGFPIEEGWNQLVHLLKHVNGAAARCGIVIAIEPLRKSECNLVNSISEAVQLAKAVNGNNIKVLADIFHMVMENEDPSVMAVNKSFISHVHFANPIGRVFPKDIKEFDYQPFISCLKQAGYTSRVSIEAYSNNFTEEVLQALAFCRKWLG